MRLLHTADLHLGKILHEQSLLDDQSVLLEQIARELETGNYDLFVVAGDVFDRSVPPPEAVLLWDGFLRRVAALPGLETVIVPGNHDGASRMAFASSFLGAHHIHLRTRVDELERPLTFRWGGDEWDVFAVPFLQAGSLEVVKDGQAAVLRSQRDLWEEARRRLTAARRPGVRAVLVTHLFTMGGSETDSERLFVGEAEQIPSSWLEGWDYVALGHLHRVQQPASGVWYAGSPLAYSFSEAGQEKVLLRWEDGVVTPIPLAPVRPLTRLKGTFDDFVRGEGWEAYRDHWLEVTLIDAALVPGPLERLRPRFPGLLSLVQTPVRAVEEPQAPRRRTGDLAADALRFLGDIGVEAGADASSLLVSLAQEAQNAAS